ncbi:MAG TPA: S-layer homology domain-containing protein [Chloroflexia bacterium]|nr:S-layer homology domain-containing protein [Chloroflexia bacterium]
MPTRLARLAVAGRVAGALWLLGSQGYAAGSGAEALPPPQATAPTSLPGDWPMYGHDPSRTSYNPDETAINAGNAAQLIARWHVNIGSNTVATSGAPSTANGRVYVGSSALTSPNYFAFDALTGVPVWRTNVGYAAGCFGVSIGSTAAISGTVLSVGGGDAAYYGLDSTTGARLWRNPVNAGRSGFAWTSPLLANGRSYLGIASDCDNPSVRGELRAVDEASGTVLASQFFVLPGRIGGGIWNSPALSPEGSTLVVATGEDDNGDTSPYTRAIVALDPLTLAIRQSIQEGTAGGDQDWASTPVILHDRQGRTLVAAMHKNGFIYAFDLNNLAAGALWQRQTGVTIGMMPAYDPTFAPGGTLFFSAQGQLYAVDPATGVDRWPPVATGAIHGSMAIANGLIYLNTGGGGVKVLAETTGTLLRTLLPANAGQALTGAVVSHGFIYWLSGSWLNAWSLPDWPPTPTPTPAPPLITPTPTIGPGCLFSDVCPPDYFFPSVQYLVAHNVLSGYGDNTFRPYNDTARAQLVKIIVGAFAIPPYSPANPTFSDVPVDNPFYTYIEAAFHAGLISGYGDGTFHPYANVTRGQLAKILVTAAGWPQITPGTPLYSDVPASSLWYSVVATATCRGVLSGYSCGGPGEPCDGQGRPYFRPANDALRGQTAKVVYNAITTTGTCLSR